MKRNFLTPIVALSVAATALLPSCTKEEYNLDDISDNVMFSTSLGAPIIAQRDINFIDIFDMEGLKGTFQLSDDEAKRVDEILQQNPKLDRACLDRTNNTIDLSKMNGFTLENLEGLDITLIEEEKALPKSTDFIEIDDLNKTFGDGNAINDIDEFELKMEIDNKSDFQISLSIEFATTVTTINPNGEQEEYHLPIPGTQASATDNSSKIVIPARDEGQTSTGFKTYTLSFSNIAKLIKDNNATGLLISYDLNKGNTSSFKININDGISMSLKAFVSATIDLSNI